MQLALLDLGPQGIGAGKMRPCRLFSLTHRGGTPRSRIASSFALVALLGAMGLLATLALANILPAGSSQERREKEAGLDWSPPHVDAPVPVLSATPPCPLPDVLRQTGNRAAELIDHLQNFIAHERIRYKLTDRRGIPQMLLAARFDYLVDFAAQTQVPKVHETRKPLDGTDDGHLSSIVDKGLPVLALIFYPELQRDYDMRCDGSAQWNNQPAWVIHFRQIKEKPGRTSGMEIDSKAYPFSLKGRAWIATESGQVMHLETNLVDEIPEIDLRVNAISVDYAPVRFQSQNVEIWLPQFAVAYTDFARRRMIIEHKFSDFQLFSVQTQESIQKPKVP